MESSFQGELRDKPVAIVVSEIVDRRLSGLLCLHREEAAKTIYFEGGAPVFSASDLPGEQLEARLLKDGLVSGEVIEEARQTSLTSQELGSNLVKVGALTQKAMEQSVRGLAAEIIESVFGWPEGGYLFYEYSELGQSIKLDWAPAEFVLAAARRGAEIDSIAASIAPSDRKVVQTIVGPDSFGSGAKLNSLEAFVLSSIATPTQIGEVGTMIGLPESNARGAICALLALGLLKLEDEVEIEDNHIQQSRRSRRAAGKSASAGGATENRYDGASVEWVLELVTRKLATIGSADYYAVFGIDRIAPTTRIVSTYQEIIQTFNSFRSRWPDHKELNRALDSLIAKIDEAYATLSDPMKRSAYDRPADANKKQKSSKMRTATFTQPAAPGPNGARHSGNGRPGAASTNEGERPFDASSLAEEHYRRGRARFDRSDFHTAVYHFREAARLDASQSRYHYYLGVNLCILAQARHARHSHTHDIGSHVTCTLGGGLARNPRLRHEAERHMLKAAELDRSNPEITLRLARLYQDAGMDKKAGHYFLETLLLDSGNEAAQRELGICMRPASHRR